MNRWRPLLDQNPQLSERFRSRYAVLLAQLEPMASPANLTHAKNLVTTHARRAASALLGVVAPESTTGARWTVVLRGSSAAAVDAILGHGGDLDGYLRRLPDLEQTRVPVHPARHAHVVSGGHVALRWSAESVQARIDHAGRMSSLANAASQNSPIPITVWTDYTVCTAGLDYVWTFAPNLGVTLEDHLRTESLAQGPVLHALEALRHAMLKEGLIWQGFAPRNMFLVDGQLVLIDFEELVDVRVDARRATECLLWHRIFFADCLDECQANALFAADNADLSAIADDTIVSTDAYEQALLRSDTMTWSQRRSLLAESARLEGRHHRRNGSILFGHELGHFWGDFVSAEVEATIFRTLTAVARPEELTACMEVFEAAMEADIVRILRQKALGDTEVYTPRTDALSRVDGRRLVRVRAEITGWYADVAADPVALTDEVLLRVRRSGKPTSEVLIGASRTAAESVFDRVVEAGLAFMHRTSGQPVLTYASPDELRKVVGMQLPGNGMDFHDLLADTCRLMDYSVSQAHPGYLAFPDSANSLAAVAGAILAKFLNQNLIAVDRSGPAATFVEIQVLEWLRELVGYPSKELTELQGVKDVGGLWTTGGHLSNHVAMLAALGARFPHVRRHGLRTLDTQPSVIMSGAIAHYSHSDAAFHLGLGWDSVLTVEANPDYTTDVDAVEKLLADPPPGHTPFIVVGVAGNCRTTGLDDLAALSEVCKRYGVWLHADACHGGSLIFNEGLRRRHLAGIEQADSVSLDPHKGLFTPYPSSYVLFKDRGVLTQFSRHEATVQRDDCWDLGLITPFLGSRGFESLATWMMLRHIGTQRLGEIVEDRQSLVRYLEYRIDASGLFVCLNDVDFYRLAFVLCPLAAATAIRRLDPAGRRRAARIVSEFTSRLNTTLYHAGRVCFDEHSLADLSDRVGAGRHVSYTVMASCPGNPLLTREDLDAAVDELVRSALRLVGPMLAAIRGDAEPQPVGVRLGGPAGWGDQ